MKPLVVILFLLLAGPLTGTGQISLTFAKSIASADTVLLVTHGQTEGAVIRKEKSGKYEHADSVVIKGRPNLKVITDSKILPVGQRKKLVTILRRPFQDKTIETCNCFVPFHAIVVIKERVASYIEICFDCNSLHTSEKTASLDYLDKRKQRELKELFAEVGLSTE